jgi:hypothetical protein
MSGISYFEQLEESVVLIARHPPFPGKSAAVEQCAEEIQDLVRSGGITGEQGGTLLKILAGGYPQIRHVSLSRL